jgi:hypothetical protein
VKFITVQFSPRSVFLPFRSKYHPQYSVLKNPQSVFLPKGERPSFAPINNIRKILLVLQSTFTVQQTKCWPYYKTGLKNKQATMMSIQSQVIRVTTHVLLHYTGYDLIMEPL